MPRINLLPDNLINQIAAGEVIERPASVVKELLDNSLDAGADQITIDVEQGGVGLIRVKDNGSGIHHDDLSLALTRHATSKIRSLDDLRQIVSMGFRGEALPSMASISRTIIMSKFIDDDHAWMIKSEGRSDPSQPEPASHPQGTTVEVRDLFFNVPARRKYLRTERTEFYQIQQLVRHFAISHPEIAVRLTHNGRQVLNVKSVSGKDEGTRASDICGSKFLQHSIRIDSKVQGLHLTGWAGKPEVARTMNDSQFFCLNGRCIRDKRVNHAIQQAFQDSLPVGRYAVYALYLMIDPSVVDVNVHPAKTEVRFRDGRSVHDFIYSALHQVLSDQQYSLAEISETAMSSHLPQTTKASTFRGPSFYSVQETGGRYSPDLASVKNQEKIHLDSVSKTDQIGNVLYVRKGDELLLIDIQKTTTFLCATKLHSELKQGSVSSKPLLFPHGIELDKASAGLIETHSNLLMELGIIFHKSNHKNIQWHLRKIPNVISISDPDSFVSEILNSLQKKQCDFKTNLIDILASFSEALPNAEIILEFLKLTDQQQKNLVRKLSEQDLQKLITDQK